MKNNILFFKLITIRSIMNIILVLIITFLTSLVIFMNQAQLFTNELVSITTNSNIKVDSILFDVYEKDQCSLLNFKCYNVIEQDTNSFFIKSEDIDKMDNYNKINNINVTKKQDLHVNNYNIYILLLITTFIIVILLDIDYDRKKINIHKNSLTLLLFYKYNKIKLSFIFIIIPFLIVIFMAFLNYFHFKLTSLYILLFIYIILKQLSFLINLKSCTIKKYDKYNGLLFKDILQTYIIFMVLCSYAFIGSIILSNFTTQLSYLTYNNGDALYYSKDSSNEEVIKGQDVKYDPGTKQFINFRESSPSTDNINYISSNTFYSVTGENINNAILFDPLVYSKEEVDLKINELPKEIKNFEKIPNNVSSIYNYNLNEYYKDSEILIVSDDKIVVGPNKSDYYIKNSQKANVFNLDENDLTYTYYKDLMIWFIKAVIIILLVVMSGSVALKFTMFLLDCIIQEESVLILNQYVYLSKSSILRNIYFSIFAMLVINFIISIAFVFTNSLYTNYLCITLIIVNILIIGIIMKKTKSNIKIIIFKKLRSSYD